MPLDEIVPISERPPLPPQIVDAVNSGTLAVFIGAGVSRIIGCDDWKTLANNLIESCFSNSCINFKEKETLSTYDPKKSITICKHILAKKGLEEDFIQIIKDSLKSKKCLTDLRNIYHELYRLRGLFITTNVDDCFYDKFERLNIAYKEEDFKLSLNNNYIDNSKLYQIHGSLLSPETLVFTVSDYLQKYNKSPNFQNFMIELFSKYTILFVGYGLEEFEVLDYLITKFDHSEIEIKHFILLPYYRNENRIVEFDRLYYRDLGITVLPYEKDERGYNQLYEVIKHWNSEINQISTYLSESFREIDEAVASFDDTSTERIFQIILNDEPQRNHFFETLASCDNPFPWLKLLREKEYFDPKENPSPKQVSDNGKIYFEVKYWNILGYLKNIATKNAVNLESEITRDLSQIIDSIIVYRDENGARIENYHTDSVLIDIIFKLPVEVVEDKYIVFIEHALNSKINKVYIAIQVYESAFPFLISNKKTDLLLKLLDVIFNYEECDNFYKYSSLVENYWLSKAIFEYRTEIIELCGMDAAEMILHKIEEIISEDDTQFRTALITTIEDSDQNINEERYAYQCVSFVRDIFEATDPEILKPIISDLLSKSHPIFRRIAIHTISYHYNSLHEIFWDLNFNPIDDYSIKHEIYELLSKNCLSFSRSELDTAVNWIESADYHADDLQLSSRDEYLAYKKKCWLSSILEVNDPYITSLNLKYEKINPEEISHPGDIIHFESFEGSMSPISESKLLVKSNNEIAEYLSEFREKTGVRTPSKEGLAETLQKCVSNKPEKFSENLSPYLSVPEIYQHYILWGLTEACRNRRNFSWNNVLNFISQLLESTNFWNIKQAEDESDYRNWIVSQIADLVDEGLLKDHTFENGTFSLAEDILLTLAQKANSDFHNMGDLTTSVLNSSKGKIFSALIDYSMRLSHSNIEGEERKWKESIKSEFNTRLDRDFEPSVEFSYILGKYISHLFYLDEYWTKENIDEIFLADQDKHWEAAFTGYLFYCSKIDKRIYFLLREKGHYKKAIQTKFGDNHINERLVQHICIGYIEGWEKLNDKESLIFQLLEEPDPQRISEIIRYFETQNNEITEKVSSKIKPLWNLLYNILSSNEGNKDYQVVASDLLSWVSLIDYIDPEILEWIKFSVRNLDSVPDFIEDLVIHAQKTPSEVGKIYIEMLKNGKYPYYHEDETKEIVRILYENGQKEIADRIYNCFELKGYGGFLREIYKEYNSLI
jgi:hypothetical protein